METAEENDFVVVVQMEETTSTAEQSAPKEEPVLEKEETLDDSPASEQEETSEDDDLTDVKLLTVIMEEENSQENKNVTLLSIENNNIGEVNDINPASASTSGIDKETNSNMNDIGDNNTQQVNSSTNPEEVNELNRKRVQESSNKAAEEKVQEDDFDGYKRRKAELFTDIKGPEWYNVKGNVVTRSIIPKNLTKQFEFLPIFGRPDNRDVDGFHREKIREFIGPDIDDDEFEELAKYCSPNNLKTGKELVVEASMPSQGILSADDATQLDNVKANLCVLKKCKMRVEKDKANNYSTKLKYRGVRLIPLNQDEDKDMSLLPDDVMLEPGRDILFRIRLYRPYYYQITKERYKGMSWSERLVSNGVCADAGPALGVQLRHGGGGAPAPQRRARAHRLHQRPRHAPRRRARARRAARRQRQGSVPVWLPVHKQHVLRGHARGVQGPEPRDPRVGGAARDGRLPRAGHARGPARGHRRQTGLSGGVRPPRQLRARVYILRDPPAVLLGPSPPVRIPAPLRRVAAPDGVLHHVRGVRRQVGGGGVSQGTIRPCLLLRHVLQAVPVHRRSEDRRLQGVSVQRQ
ncbi:hypothetical protein O3G_MSEX013004 [Manduca sexta]|uniref:Uncharacterized protein n=1 Tax=Manduca sexta TaxID=7130 RepID=A0A922CWE7_MANSE|nr:hypothetical protein O3G_MSEX013004 [Manduca sexta]